LLVEAVSQRDCAKLYDRLDRSTRSELGNLFHRQP